MKRGRGGELAGKRTNLRGEEAASSLESALPPKAEVSVLSVDVCFVPGAVIQQTRATHSRATLENTIRKALREDVLRSAGGRGAKLTRQASRQEEEGEPHPMLLYRTRQRR